MVVMSWRGMYGQLLKDKRPRELRRLRACGELDEVLMLASRQARETYRTLAPELEEPMCFSDCFYRRRGRCEHPERSR